MTAILKNGQFGQDLAGLLDINRQLTFTRNGLDTLAQDVVGIILDDHLFYDAEHCYPLERLLINNNVPTNVREIEAGIEAAVLRDERIDGVDATMVRTPNGQDGDYTITIRITPSDSESFEIVGLIENFEIGDWIRNPIAG